MRRATTTGTMLQHGDIITFGEAATTNMFFLVQNINLRNENNVILIEDNPTVNDPEIIVIEDDETSVRVINYNITFLVFSMA